METEKHIFYDDGDVKITENLIVVNDTAFPLDNVQDVCVIINKIFNILRITASILVILAVAFIYVEIQNNDLFFGLLAVICFICGLASFLFSLHSKSLLIIKTMTQYQRVLHSKDVEYLNTIKNAINEALKR